MTKKNANGVAVMGRDGIMGQLGGEGLERHRVRVPEWAGVVLIREMTAAERDVWEIASIKGEVENLRARLVSLVLVDEEGNRLFNGENDIKALGNKSASAMDRIFDAACRVNGIGAEDLEELEKN